MFFVSSLSELHINTDMAISLADFTAFVKDEGKSIKRGENHLKSGLLRAAATGRGS